MFFCMFENLAGTGAAKNECSSTPPKWRKGLVLIAGLSSVADPDDLT